MESCNLMKTTFVRENYIGDKKKQLRSGDSYEVIGVNNISGGGNLFIKNQVTGMEEKCYTTDWDNPRKYSSVIMERTEEFTRGGDIYKKLKIGKSKRWKVGDGLIFLKKLGTSSSLDWHPTTYFFIIRDFTLYKIKHIIGEKIVISNKNNSITYVFRSEWFDHNQDLWEPIQDTNEAENFTRGMNPYKKLGIGKYSDPDYLKNKKRDEARIKIIQNLIKNSAWQHPDDDALGGGESTREYRRRLYNEKKHLKDKYKTEDQFDKEAERRNKADQKSHNVWRAKEKEKKKKLKTLTSKQVAINRIIDIQYWKRTGGISVKHRDEIITLKAEHDIKAYDLRRQKEYSAKYDDTVEENFTRGGNPYKKLGIGRYQKWKLMINLDNFPIIDEVMEHSIISEVQKQAVKLLRETRNNNPNKDKDIWSQVFTEYIDEYGEKNWNEHFEERLSIEDDMDNEYRILRWGKYPRGRDQWDIFVEPTNETESFTRGGNPYKKLGINREEWDIRIYEGNQMIEHLGRVDITEEEMQTFIIEWLDKANYKYKSNLDDTVKFWTRLKRLDKKTGEWVELAYSIVIKSGGYYLWEKKKEPILLKSVK